MLVFNEARVSAPFFCTGLTPSTVVSSKQRPCSPVIAIFCGSYTEAALVFGKDASGESCTSLTIKLMPSVGSFEFCPVSTSLQEVMTNDVRAMTPDITILDNLLIIIVFNKLLLCC